MQSSDMYVELTGWQAVRLSGGKCAAASSAAPKRDPILGP